MKEKIVKGKKEKKRKEKKKTKNSEAVSKNIGIKQRSLKNGEEP